MLLQKLSGFYPKFFTFIGLIDHLFIYLQFLVCDERLQLVIDKRDIIGRKLSGYVDILNHISLFSHFSINFRTIELIISVLKTDTIK